MRELSDETLKKIAHELAENLRKNLTVDWSARESVQAKLRLMVKRMLRRYKYPPDQQDAAVELVLHQAKALGETGRRSSDRFTVHEVPGRSAWIRCLNQDLSYQPVSDLASRPSFAASAGQPTTRC